MCAEVITGARLRSPRASRDPGARPQDEERYGVQAQLYCRDSPVVMGGGRSGERAPGTAEKEEDVGGGGRAVEVRMMRGGWGGG